MVTAQLMSRIGFYKVPKPCWQLVCSSVGGAT